MTSHVRDGVVVPDRVAGHLALELCNTRAGWGSEQPREYLLDHRTLLAWGLDNGLLTAPPPPLPPTPDPLDLALVLRLRDVAYPILTGSRDPELFARLTAVLLDVRAGARLVPDGDGPARWRVDLPDVSATPTDPVPTDPVPTDTVPTDPVPTDSVPTDSAAGAAVALAVAIAVESLLTSPAIGDVGVCAGPGCGWLFLDPRHRRRWCSMAVCGNRAKARRHNRRHPG
jgi:hypothetical protein